MPVTPIPDGFHTATPQLIIRDAARALAFYREAFGATELLRLTDPASGKVVHAEIRIGDSILMLTDEFPEWGNRSPTALEGTSVQIHLYVADADAVVATAIEAGALEVFPVADQFYGDRAGRIADPFGHVWIIATHKEDMTADEMQRRTEAFLAKGGAG